MVKVSKAYRTGTVVVRCWVPWPEPPSVLDVLAQHKKLEAYSHHMAADERQPGVVAEELCDFMQANAVEVLDHDGNGAIHYPSWP